MSPYVEIRFERHVRDESLASCAHHWVARLEAMRIPVAAVAVEIAAEKRRTSVVLSLTLADGTSAKTATSHVDPYVAVAEAFRSARRDLLRGA